MILGFEYKRYFSPEKLPLAEVALDLIDLEEDEDEFRDVLEELKGQPLVRLVLHLEELDIIPVLAGVVEAFPLLQTLSVFRGDEAEGSDWDISDCDVALILGKLRFLKTLRWNRIGEEFEDVEEYVILGEVAISCLHSLNPLAEMCRSLTLVQCAWQDLSFTGPIERDGDGGFDLQNWNMDGEAIHVAGFHTSSWERANLIKFRAFR
ncbi:hypothetical protein K439DRAFT_1024573 [Ramaria rubella]|nr:hypothetical protein K439DRAFT_1024573 [Ramaria rubella]